MATKTTKKEETKEVTTTLHITIPKELDKWLMEEAKNQDRTKLSMVRFILNEYRRNNQ